MSYTEQEMEQGRAAYSNAYPTSLGKLSEHDWRVLESRWFRGIDWNICKCGRKWRIMGEEFQTWPLYRTKTAAYEAQEKIMLAEAKWRAGVRLGFISE